MKENPVIDVHAHILDREAAERMSREAPQAGFKLRIADADSAFMEVGGGKPRKVPRGGWDLEERLRVMDEHGIDMQVLSVVPGTLFYDVAPEIGAVFSAIQNEQIAERVRQYPDRFLGIAAIPMQAPEAAAAELRRATLDLGLKGAMIGSQVCGRNLDDPELEPVWATAAELGSFLLIHPHKISGDRLQSYYLTNLIGNPVDTTIAAASLVFGGVMERHPDLKIMLSHGGGFTPFQAGRFIHGWEVRREPKERLSVSPEQSLGRFFYDTITHSEHVLKSLIEWVGSDRILVGTDYPYDMGDFGSAQTVERLDIAREWKTAITSSNPRRLLGIDA